MTPNYLFTSFAVIFGSGENRRFPLFCGVAKTRQYYIFYIGHCLNTFVFMKWRDYSPFNYSESDDPIFPNAEIISLVLTLLKAPSTSRNAMYSCWLGQILSGVKLFLICLYAHLVLSLGPLIGTMKGLLINIPWLWVISFLGIKTTLICFYFPGMQFVSIHVLSILRSTGVILSTTTWSILGIMPLGPGFFSNNQSLIEYSPLWVVLELNLIVVNRFVFNEVW